MMEVGILSVHVLYVFFIGAIILFMLLREDTTFISLFGIFIISLWASHSLSASVSSLFHSFIYAAGELLPTIFIICFIVSMSDLLTKTGINEAMISPFASLVRGPVTAYWLIGGLMFAISLFFWPSPGVALIGVVLLPRSRTCRFDASCRGHGHELIRTRFCPVRRLCHSGGCQS